MLDGRDRDTLAVRERGAERRLLRIPPVGRHAGAAAIAPAEDDAAVGRRGMQNHRHTVARMNADAAARHGRLDGLLRNSPQVHD